MRFAPKTKEELDFDNLLPKGEYDFEVVKAEDAVSKKTGADMIKANLKVFHGEGFQFVTDYLMEKMAFKLHNFFETVGMMDAYNAGEIKAADLVGACGKVQIDIEAASGDFPAKNVVKNYGSKAKKDAEKQAAKPAFIREAEADDLESKEDIPF